MGLAPGVYVEEIPRAPRAPLGTGVPAFLCVPGISEVVELDASLDALEKKLTGHTYFAVRGFFENGGRRCYLVPAEPGNSFAGAIERLGPFGDVDLVAAPELVATAEGADALAEAQAKLLQRCAGSGRLFAILDPPAERGQSEAHREKLERALRDDPGASYGALYLPWIKVEGACATCHGKGSMSGRACPTCSGTTAGFVPPSGHLAGVYARTDRSAGVFRAPANTIVAGAVDVATVISSAEDGALDEEGINSIRSFPGRGIRVWGARTLSRHSSYRYVNVRRLILTLRRWLEASMRDLVFEPQSPLLWLRLSRQVDAVLGSLFQRGALAGATPTEAYYVKCDEENNPPDVRTSGQVVAEVGLAPACPSEFIRLSVIQGEDGIHVSDLG